MIVVPVEQPAPLAAASVRPITSSIRWGIYVREAVEIPWRKTASVADQAKADAFVAAANALSAERGIATEFQAQPYVSFQRGPVAD